MVSPPIEKFLNRTQGIQQFVAVRSGRDRAYEAAFEEMQAIVTSLIEFDPARSDADRLEQAKAEFLTVLDRLEQHLTESQIETAAKLDRTEQQFQGQNLEHWRHQAKQMIKAFNLEREEFFRAAKGRLNRTRSTFSTPFLPDSLTYELGTTIDSLLPIATRKKHRTHLFLRTPTEGDIHAALLHLCSTMLTQWHQAEQEIIYLRCDNGLISLLERYQKQFDERSVETEAIDILIEKQPNLNIDWQSSLEKLANAVEPPKNYTCFDNFEDITGSVIRLVLQISFIALITLFNRFVALVLVIGTVFNLMNIASQVFAAPQKRRSRIEQSTASLKRQLTTDYQAIARYLLDATFQNLTALLDAQEQQVRKAIDAIDEQINRQYSEARRQQDEARSLKQLLLQEKAQVMQIKLMLQAGI